jgi:hypothetical protein
MNVAHYLFMVFCVLFFLAGHTVHQSDTRDIFSYIGIPKQDAEDDVITNIISGHLSYPFSTAYKAIPTSQRPYFVRWLGATIKVLVYSEVFKARYVRSLYPDLKPPDPPKSAEMLLQHERARLKQIQSALESEPRTAKTKGEKKQRADKLQQVKTALEQLEKKRSTFSEEEKKQKENFAAELERYTQRKAEVDSLMREPLDLKPLLKKRLHEFLDFTATIDFDAKLNRDGTFENEDYEDQTDEWKACYRMGKETITAARLYAEEWLKELE